MDGDADICPCNVPWGPEYFLDQPSEFDEIMGRVTFFNTSIRITWENMKRLIFTVWPMDSERLANLATQGYHDALRFLAIRGTFLLIVLCGF